MARVKLKFPDQTPLFVTHIPLRVTDMNYGNHLGNDALLSIVHEARVQFLCSLSANELNIGEGKGLIMSDAAIAYKNEGRYGDMLQISIYPEEITDRSFDLLYKLQTLRQNALLDIAHVKTGMVCFDYAANSVATLPQAFLGKINGGG
ncbi:MAG: thioesterase family protein [Edaphocola sp.]